MALIHLEPLPRSVSKNDILALLNSAGGLDRRRVGRIELRGRQAVVEVPDASTCAERRAGRAAGRSEGHYR